MSEVKVKENSLSKIIKTDLTTVENRIKDFEDGEKNIAICLQSIVDLKLTTIENDLDRENFLKAVKSAKSVIKDYEGKRLNLTRPVDDIKSQVINISKITKLPLVNKVNDLESILTKYDRKVEADRQAEKLRLEEERKERERQAERARVKMEQENNMINDLNRDLESKTSAVNSMIDLNEAISFVHGIAKNITRFGERLKDAEVILNLAKERLESMRPKIKELEDLRLRQAKADEDEKERLRKQEEMAEEEIRLENERKGIEAEKEQLRQEQEQLSRSREIRDAEECDDIVDKEKENKKSKLKYLNLSFDIELIDINLVPNEFTTRVLNRTLAKKWIKKNNKSIKGIKAFYKDGK